MSACPICGEPCAVRRGQEIQTCGQRACVSARISERMRGNRNGAKDDDAPRDKWGRRAVEVACAECGTPFLTVKSGLATRRCCSVKCAAQRKRGVGRDRKGTQNPNYRSGARSGVRDREGERRWFDGMPKRCENPACQAPVGQLAAHHCVYRQEIRRHDGDLWDARNRLVLCAGCHSSHHRRGRVIAAAALPSSVLDFACDLLGAPAAYEYLRRRYSGDDPRLEALIA